MRLPFPYTQTTPPPRAFAGLQGCGIDTLAMEGTGFTIPFYVWDGGSPPLRATASRSIVLSAACPSTDAPHFCQDNSGAWFCSGACAGWGRCGLHLVAAQARAQLQGGGDTYLAPAAHGHAWYGVGGQAQQPPQAPPFPSLRPASHMARPHGMAGLAAGTPCNVASRFLPPARRTPLITLLPASASASVATVYIPYGAPAPFSLQPCPSGASNSSCAAVAHDTDAAGRAVADLTPSLRVEEVLSCTDGQVRPPLSFAFQHAARLPACLHACRRACPLSCLPGHRGGSWMEAASTALPDASSCPGLLRRRRACRAMPGS
jgi:hypothetical protein